MAIQKKRLTPKAFWIAAYGLLAVTDQGFVSSHTERTSDRPILIIGPYQQPIGVISHSALANARMPVSPCRLGHPIRSGKILPARSLPALLSEG